MTPNQRKAAGWATICVALTSGFEGLRQNAYPDVTGVPTICFGETRGVSMTDHKTKEECKAKLEGRLQEFAAEVDRCTTVPLTPSRKAAMVDFAYNLGSGRYCKYIAPQLNAGKTVEACNHLLKFNTAGGIVFPGLTRRREAERQLCLLPDEDKAKDSKVDNNRIPILP